MSGKFSQKEVANLLIESMDESRKEYDNINETLLSDTPEYFITVNAVKKISQRYSYKDVTMEWNVKQSLEEIADSYNGGHRKPGRPPDGLRQNGRFDIALWEKDLLYGFIEVKKIKHAKRDYVGDLKRIRAALIEAAYYDYNLFGVLAFYLERKDSKRGKTAETKIQDYVSTIHEEVDCLMKEVLKFRIIKGEPTRYSGEYENMAFQPFCIVVHN